MVRLILQKTRLCAGFFVTQPLSWTSLSPM